MNVVVDSYERCATVRLSSEMIPRVYAIMRAAMRDKSLSEIMQRIAVPMIGGMVSSTILTLAVIPAIYALLKGRELLQGDARAANELLGAKS